MSFCNIDNKHRLYLQHMGKCAYYLKHHQNTIIKYLELTFVLQLIIYRIINNCFNYSARYFNKRTLITQSLLKSNKLYLHLNLILHQLRLNYLDAIKVFSFN